MTEPIPHDLPRHVLERFAVMRAATSDDRRHAALGSVLLDINGPDILLVAMDGAIIAEEVLSLSYPTAGTTPIRVLVPRATLAKMGVYLRAHRDSNLFRVWHDTAANELVIYRSGLRGEYRVPCAPPEATMPDHRLIFDKPEAATMVRKLAVPGDVYAPPSSGRNAIGLPQLNALALLMTGHRGALTIQTLSNGWCYTLRQGLTGHTTSLRVLVAASILAE